MSKLQASLFSSPEDCERFCFILERWKSRLEMLAKNVWRRGRGSAVEAKMGNSGRLRKSQLAGDE